MPKRNPPNPELSKDREFTIVLEDLRGQFRVFGEGLQLVDHRLDRLENDVSQLKDDVSSLKNDVSVIKVVIPTLATKKNVREIVGEIHQRLDVLESVR